MKELFKFKYDDLFNPTLNALHNLGGSASVAEMEEQIAILLNLTDGQINEIHRGNTSKLNYRLAWARNYLKRFGLLENSSRGIWALTEKGLKTKTVNKELVKREVKSSRIDNDDILSSELAVEEQESEEIVKFTWQEEVIDELQKITPSSFERLCQRLLRELGFQNVEVTGQTNDGGIDGKGILKIGSVLSFHVIFQAKRYKGTVSSSVVRDFRGAMVGRADKGLIITTGIFSREAKKEAQRDGTPPIDLVDGNDLAEKLKELRLGIDVELVEKVNIRTEWFKTF
ncbi:restriction system protein [Arcicella aurantiaca]|uniref:Restriction system protein n=1 Tax=Arcicella aurantiaca TaxID=591202 RepID=A0A316E995_9BACT|nr:restriction endonuclease [Arcicella aurantiaca]PWK26640.1 restriction system protein [Arcicella aurantiaca]